jgi:nucleolar pre-ribosomal-associated protein 1
MRCVATSEACETGASFRERSQVVSLLTAVRNAIPGDEPAKRMPTAAAVLAAEAAAASLHPACETYVPLQRAVLRRAALDTDALPISFLSMLNGGGGGGGGAGGDEGGMMSTRGEARALRVWVLRLLLASLRSGPDDARLFRKAFTVEVLMSHRSAALSADPYARQLALAVVGRAARTPIAARALVEGSGLIPWLAAAASSACHPTRAHVGEGYGARAAAAAAAVTALADLAEQRGAIHGGPSGTAADFLSALRDVRAALAPLCHDKHGGGGGGSGELAVCRAMLAPTLRLHVAIARQLSRRRGEVIDVAEVAALCGAVDAAARAEPGVRTGSATNTRGGSRTSGSGSGSGPGASRIVGNSSGVLRAAMLEVVVGSAGAGRNSMFPIGSVTGEHTALAAARALAAVVPWAAAAAAAMTATVGVTRGGADVEAAAGADDAVGKVGVKLPTLFCMLLLVASNFKLRRSNSKP